MRKEILNSIIITVLLISAVYFVVGGLVEGNGRQTFYNVTTADGVAEKSPNIRWWNPYTNYSGNTSTIISGNSIALNFTFSLNHSSTVEFNGNISNITIVFPNLFQVDRTSLNANYTRCVGAVTPAFKQWNLSTTTVIFYNDTNGGLTNRTGGGSYYNNCTFSVNVTVNGTGNTNTETTGTITVTASNSSNTNTANVLSFTAGVDSLGPRITNVQVSNGVETRTLVSGTTQAVTLSNVSNITISATITDANIWRNVTADRHTGGGRDGNITVWWNETGVATRTARVNQTNMTNTSSCTWAEGAAGCTFSATLPMTGNYFAEGGNLSFIITAADYFEHATNNSNGDVGYNLTFDNTANNCYITIPDERFINYRSYTISCDGDANMTRMYESQSGVEICNNPNTCTGTYTPDNSGTRTLECETQDNSGNKQTCSLDVLVYSRESVYAGEGAAGGAEEVPTALDISQEAGTTGLSTGQSTTFRYGTLDHIIKVDSITLDSATITVDSVSATIPSGGSKEFDLTGDGTNDIKVTLNKIMLNRADISVEKLAGATTEAPEVVEEQARSLTWLWVVLILIVLAVIVYLVISARKNK